jgi:hypothetical protein
VVDQIEQIINLATASLGGPVRRWNKGSDNESVLRPSVKTTMAGKHIIMYIFSRSVLFSNKNSWHQRTERLIAL